MKEIKENGAVKTTKPYKMKFFKKVLSAIGIAAVTAAMFIGVAFTMTACGSSEPTPEPPPITNPVDPDPDDPDQPVDPDPDDPDQPVDPDPDDPDQPVDPDPDDPDQPVDPDPDNPDQPVDPDPDDPDQPDNPDNPPPEPEVPVIDSLDDLEMEEPDPGDYDDPEALEEAQEKYEAAQEAKELVGNTLHDNLYEEMIYRTVGSDYDLSKVEDEKWEIVDNDKDGNIDLIKLRFFYNEAETSKDFRISVVDPKIDITLADLLTETPDTEKLEEAFTAGRGGAKYSSEYVFSYNPSIQTERAELLNAVNTKLATDGVISAVDENTHSFIRDNGTTTDSALNGTARQIVVMNLTENGYEEVSIRIKENQSNNNDTTLIENLNADNYYEIEADARSGEFSGTVLENVDLPQQETVTATSYKLVYTNDKGEREEYDLDY